MDGCSSNKSHTFKNRENIRRLVSLALFCALAYAAMFMFRINVVFLTFEPKDAIIAVAAMVYGPLAGVSVSLVVTVLEMITVSGTGFYGWIMNFASSASFVVISSLIYRRFRSIYAAAAGLAAGAAGMTIVMLLLNLFITPLYANVKVEAVIAMIPTLLLPFNLIKGILNSAIVLMLYKPLSRILRRARMAPAEVQVKVRAKIPGYIVILSGLLIAVVCVLVLLFVLGGDLSLIKK